MTIIRPQVRPLVLRPRYEPEWRCDLCGSDRLLAESHVCCPNCGHARDAEPIRFPHWDELPAQHLHRFDGSARSCCEAGWSAHARHCGHCGRRLQESV